jgi:hypothetical protein
VTNPEPMEMHSVNHLTEPALKSQPESQRQSRDVEVAASPFNGIKIELGFAILLGAILWLAADSITVNETTQWLMLLGYGLTSMCWLMLRTRAVLRRCVANGETNP